MQLFVLFCLIMVGLPLAKFLGILELSWKEALFPAYLMMTLFILVFVTIFAVIMIGAM